MKYALWALVATLFLFACWMVTDNYFRYAGAELPLYWTILLAIPMAFLTGVMLFFGGLMAESYPEVSRESSSVNAIFWFSFAIWSAPLILNALPKMNSFFEQLAVYRFWIAFLILVNVLGAFAVEYLKDWIRGTGDSDEKIN